MTLNGVMAITLRYFNEFGKRAFQTYNGFVEHWTYWSRVNFYNTHTCIL